MTVTNQRGRDAAAWIVEESTFGTDPGSPTQIYPVVDSVTPKPEREEIENAELRTDLYDDQETVHGLKRGSLSWAQYLRPDATVLTAAATATTPWCYLPLRIAFGDEFPATGATTIGDTVSASTASTITVSSGARFSKGTWVMPTVGARYEPARIINIATNTITLDPQPTATPTASGAAVAQMYNYAPARSYSKSFSFRYALAGTAGLQWLLRGCKMDSVAFDLTLGQLAKATFNASVTTWGHASSPTTAPGALGYTATAGTNSMRKPFVVRECYLVLQAATGTSAARAAHFSCESVGVEVDLGTEFVPDLGGVDGRAGVMRVGGRTFAKMTVRCRPDITADVLTVDATYWASQTLLQAALLVAMVDSAGATRWLVIDLPSCFISPKPTFVFDGGRALLEFTLRSKRSAIVTSPTEGNNFHYAPALVALG